MPTAECFFLDVGQGSCQVVLLPTGDALVVDCGPNYAAEVPLRLLARYLNGQILALVVTHNHADHDGGAARLFEHYAPRIRKVCFLRDCRPDYIKLLSLARAEKQTGRFRGCVQRLECSSSTRPLYRDSANDIEAKILAPNFEENLSAEGKPNETSAVLLLRCGKCKVLLTGDSPFTTWQGIAERLGGPIVCDVCGVPHHGGGAGAKQPYGQSICATYGVVSVGTVNEYRHPAPETIHALTDAGMKVICTQMTRRCTDNLESCRTRPVPLVGPGLASRAEDRSQKGKSRNVACAGTVLVQLDHDSVVVRHYEAHRAYIMAKASRDQSFHPLCLPS